MAEQPAKNSWWHSIPGLLTGIGALLTAATGLYVALRDDHAQSPPAAPASAATTAPPAASPTAVSPPAAVAPARAKAEEARAPAIADIAGVWRDNWGTVSRLTQDGSTFEFSGTGSSCRGGSFRSSGAGRIDGKSLTSSFQTDLPSSLKFQPFAPPAVGATP